MESGMSIHSSGSFAVPGDNDLPLAGSSSSQKGSHMNREIHHVKYSVSKLREITLTPEQETIFVQRFEAHKRNCVECSGKPAK